MIIGYLYEMLKTFLLTTPFYLLCRFLYLRFKAKGDKLNWYHEAGLLTLFCYIAGLCSITMNLVSLAITVAGGNFGLNLYGVNLVPFRQIAQYAALTDLHEVINIIGNILMFAPVGFLAVLLWRQRHPILAGTVSTAAFSVLIELVQLFSARGTDIDDVILNTVGGLIGALLALAFKRLAPRLFARFAV